MAIKDFDGNIKEDCLFEVCELAGQERSEKGFRELMEMLFEFKFMPVNTPIGRIVAEYDHDKSSGKNRYMELGINFACDNYLPIARVEFLEKKSVFLIRQYDFHGNVTSSIIVSKDDLIKEFDVAEEDF